MKKTGFLSGAFVSTFCIILCKIVGLLYVIPFYSIIGTQGGTLYSYAYTIYSLFLTLSSQGIPVAMSKIVSEYNTLGQHWSKEKAYKIIRNLMIGLGLFWFILLLIFAEKIAFLIIGDIEGGNTIQDVALVIRSISLALVVVPFLSSMKGYLSGHKYLTQYAFSNVIEQLVRVFVIIIGSFLAAKVFNLPVAQVVGVATLGATIGAFVSYLYLKNKKTKNAELFKNDAIKTEAEKNNTTKSILKRIIVVALPFVVIDFVRSIYSIVDTFTVNATLTSLGYTLSDSEYILSVISTWGSKLNMIVISFEAGLAVSLIPNISSSYIKRDMKDVAAKLNQSFQMILFINLPLVIGLNLLATPVWSLFYGYNELGITIFQLFVFQALTFSLYSLAIDAAQVMGNTKLALSSLFISFFLKLILNVPFMRFCPLIGIEAQFAPIILNLILHLFTTWIILFIQAKKYKISYHPTINPAIKTILISLIMFVSLKIVQIFIPTNLETTAFKNFAICVLYALVGGVIYLYLSYKTGLLNKVFNCNVEEKVKKTINKIFKKKALKQK